MTEDEKQKIVFELAEGFNKTLFDNVNTMKTYENFQNILMLSISMITIHYTNELFKEDSLKKKLMMAKEIYSGVYDHIANDFLNKEKEGD